MDDFFKVVSIYLGLKQSSTTVYHSETRGKTELYKKTLVARLTY